MKTGGLDNLTDKCSGSLRLFYVAVDDFEGDHWHKVVSDSVRAAYNGLQIRIILNNTLKASWVMSLQDYKDYRREYDGQGLRREQLALSPWQQLSQWLKEAEQACPLDATSMSLATVSDSGMPSCRIVLMKSMTEQGLVWYTDSRSQKGLDLAQNNQASVLFYWQPLERQVRISGTVTMLPEATADAYFDSRPRASQVSAAATPQSQIVSGLPQLEQNVFSLEQRHQNEPIERPKPWVGYCLVPTHFEFWQGRPSRLHDRFKYSQSSDGWAIDRLAP